MTTLRSRELFHDARHRVVALEAIDLISYTSDAACHCAVTIMPYAVIVSSSGNIYAVDMEGRQLDLATLRGALSD